MATPQRKNLDTPDERHDFPLGTFNVVQVGDITLGRAVYQPGWRWSEHVKDMVGTASCQEHHRGYLISGRAAARLDDGTEVELAPGDVYEIPPGHDGWALGDEPVVSLELSAELSPESS